MSVLNYLENLEDKLKLTQNERDSIETSIKTLKTRLLNYFEDSVNDIIVFGSYNRKTNLCRKADASSDVDILIVFNDFGNKPQTYIDRLKRFMENKYSTSEIHQSNPCAILELNHIKFELTPGIWSYDKVYKIPDKASSNLDWIYTRPFELDNLLQSKSHTMYQKVTRLVKYWNCLNKKYFASFELEKKVLNTTLYCYSQNLKENLFQVLKSISSDNTPQYVKDYIKKTKDIIDFIAQNETNYPITSEDQIKILFKELK